MATIAPSSAISASAGSSTRVLTLDQASTRRRSTASGTAASAIVTRPSPDTRAIGSSAVERAHRAALLGEHQDPAQIGRTDGNLGLAAFDRDVGAGGERHWWRHGARRYRTCQAKLTTHYVFAPHG